MRTIALLALLALLRGGATTVWVPLGEGTDPERVGEAVGRIQPPPVEVLVADCGCRCNKDTGVRSWRYDACTSCGRALTAVGPDSPRARGNSAVINEAEVRGHSLRFRGPNCVPLLTILRWSALEDWAKKHGLALRRGGVLTGPFALHLSGGDPQEALPALRRLEGVVSAQASGGILHVNQGSIEARVDYSGIEVLLRGHGSAIEDLSWALNRVGHAGVPEIGFRPR